MNISLPRWAQSPIDLTGRTALVVGGPGGVGEGIVRTLLDRGATVIATGRRVDRIEALATRLGAGGEFGDRLHVRVLDALAPGLDEAVAGMVAEHGQPDLVVVSVGSWGDQGRKPVLSYTDSEWEDMVAANQTSIFRLLRAIIPAMSQDGALVRINGLSADVPFPGSAAVAMSAAATKSLTRTIAAELGDSGPRIYELILGVVRTRERQLAGVDDQRWIDSTEIGTHIAELLSGTSPLGDTVVQYFTEKTTGPQEVAPTP